MSKGSRASRPSGGGGGTPRNPRRALAAGVGLLWLALAGWAQLDLEAERQRLGEEGEAKLRSLTAVADELFAAEEARFVGLLERVRTELRADQSWPHVDSLSQSGAVVSDRAEARRLASILRRALTSTQGLAALELVVAGQNGLSSTHLSAQAGLPTADPVDSREREGLAKALWYADEVGRAAQSSGRAVERGDVTFEAVADAERAMLRLAVGLHAPGELIQGALVASLDLSGLGDRLAALATGADRLTLVTPDGRRVASDALMAAADPRLAALAARASGAAESLEIFEADAKQIYARALGLGDGSVANLLLLAECPAPPTLLDAWLASPWAPTLLVLGLVSMLAVVLLLRSPVSAATEEAWFEAGLRAGREEMAEKAPPVQAADEPTAGERSEIVIRRQDFMLREWLADVRGCLEREAATRGLALDLRCERSLPAELDQDPAWLGGLVVAMGREALDATSAAHVSLQVAEDADDTLRFEVDAGGGALAAVSGMEEVAARIGGHLEAGPQGRLALVLPQALG